MGKLYQLEITNFKSYAGHQIIGPFYDFTCIIGPNGSGKSNLMDAISFVLGVQSRHLRCTNLKELIYRKNAKATPARNSTVQLTYQVSAEEVPGVKEGEMIYFSRTINPSGTSTYRYNDSEVTYDQYEEILQNIGVLVKVRNFLVFQGDVESIASKSPMELTKLLEHICGSDIYATEYEQLRKKKEEADESAIFAISKKKMFLSQLREVKLQKDEAELFQTKQKELQDYKTNQILWQLYQSQDIIIQHQTNITEHQDEMKEYDQELTNIQKNLNKLKLDANQSNTLYNKSDKAIQQTKQEKEKLESKLLPLHNKIILLKKRINENQGNEKKLKEKLNQKDSLLKTLKQQMNEMEKQLNDLKTSLNEGSGSSSGGNGGSGGGALKLTEEQRHTYSALKEKATSISSSQKLQLSSMEMEYKSLQQQYTLHQNQFDAITKESNMITNTLNDYQQRREQLINNIKSYDEELHRIQYDNKGLSESIEHALHKSQELKHQLKGIDERLLLLGDQRRKTKQEQEINAGIESMQSLVKGVYGKLSDLFRPIQQKYSKALTVAGGKLMDAIVVENKYIAQECIRYVKENRIGVFTFLPLDTIQVPNFPDRLRRIDPVHYHPCIDLIEVYEERFRPAVLYALETTLIADNLDYARHLSFDKGENVKIVTLKGQIISRSGAMTGGSLKQQITDRWEEKEYDNLKLKKRQLEEELQIYETTLEKRRLLHEFQERQRQYDARKEFCVKEIKVLEERIHSMQLQLTDKQKQIAQYQKEIESYQREINKMKQSITTLQQQIIDSEKDLFLEFSASIGVENILVYEQQMEEQQQLLQDEFVRLSKQYSSLKAQYDYERKQNISIELKQLQTEITQHQNQLEKMNNEEETIQKQLKQINDKLNDLLLQYQQYSKEKNDIHDKLMKEKKDMMDINQKRENLLKKITSDEIIIERNRAELLQIIKQTIQFNEVTLPLVNKISDKDKSDWILDFSALIEIEPSLPTQLEGKYLNLMAFSNQYPDVDTSKLSNVDKEIQQKITALVNELETMKPNLHAAEKFDDVMTKVHESSNELENCKDLVNQYALQFEEVRSQRLQLFNDCFDHINQTLSDIYRDLTKSSKHPLGGKAYFTLENREEPFLEGIRYTAMPPMKRFRDMEQLSGGEKTMAALALLFSIHSYRQAPFFVLDEVDAALDNVNVKKICSYMKQRSKEFQCVVISLKDIFFEHAEALIGVYRADDQEMACSKTLTLLLKNYPESFQEDEDEEEKEEELEGIAA